MLCVVWRDERFRLSPNSSIIDTIERDWPNLRFKSFPFFFSCSQGSRHPHSRWRFLRVLCDIADDNTNAQRYETTGEQQMTKWTYTNRTEQQSQQIIISPWNNIVFLPCTNRAIDVVCVSSFIFTRFRCTIFLPRRPTPAPICHRKRVHHFCCCCFFFFVRFSCVCRRKFMLFLSTSHSFASLSFSDWCISASQPSNELNFIYFVECIFIVLRA